MLLIKTKSDEENINIINIDINETKTGTNRILYYINTTEDYHKKGT